MASLIQVRYLLAFMRRMDAAQISQTFNTPQPMINAMLQQLESMGKAVRIQEEPDGCLSGNCKRCPEGKACVREWCALREPYSITCVEKPGMRLHPGFFACGFP